MAFDEKPLEKIILTKKKLLEISKTVLFTALCSKKKKGRITSINIPRIIKAQ